MHLPKFRDVKLEDVLRIVESNDKQRFSIRRDPDSGAVSIKANQGHTIEVPDLELKEIGQSSDVPVVVHGTYRKAYQLIKDQVGFVYHCPPHLHVPCLQLFHALRD